MNDKDPKDMTEEERKQIKIEFAPGCFDNFDGTQEELDQLMADLQRMIETGELFERARPVDIDEMSEEEAYALAQALGIDLDEGKDSDDKRILQ
jgi:hypothetical protein